MESESLIFTGLEIPRDYNVDREGIEVILEGALKVTKGHTTLRAEGAYMTF